MKTKIIIILILFYSGVIYSQRPLPNTKISNNIFTKSDKQFDKSKSISSIDFYPLNIGDFWEYNVIDTNTFSPDGISQYIRLHFSETREVIGDTLMTNGITYKIIKWEKCANSVNEPPRFEFQRKDTNGNVFIYFNGKDEPLYDFSINIKSTYPSQYPGLHWKLLKKYTVFWYNSYLFTVDYALLDSNDIIKKSVTITQNFGLARFKGNVNGDSSIPDGSFFGGVINDSTYGYLLVKKQQIDWSEFYPLHVGDFWKYRDWNQVTSSIYAKTVIKDTTINGKIYKQVLNLGLNYTQGSKSYQRMDSNIVYAYNQQKSKDDTLFIFSACVGDTNFSTNFSVWRLDNKSETILHYFMYPDVVFYSKDFSRGIGYTGGTIEFGGTSLVGAVINGVVYGDTTLTGIEEEKAEVITDYKLFQNYPNPFNPTTTIKYQIVSPSFVTLKIYDVLGKEIKTLVNQYQNAGRYNVTFNANKFASGIYIYVLKSGNYLASKKLILLK